MPRYFVETTRAGYAKVLSTDTEAQRFAKAWGEGLVAAVIDDQAEHPYQRVVCYALRPAAVQIAGALNRIEDMIENLPDKRD